MSHPPQLFDRALLKKRKTRAQGNFAQFDYLRRTMTEHALDRLSDIRRRFPRIAIFGGHLETLAQLPDHHGEGLRVLASENGPSLLAEEEWIPFGAESLDAIISIGRLHWANDLPGALIQMQRALTPDGFFLGILPGASTLIELREAFLQAEMQLHNGASPRVIPFPDVREAGMLLQRAGFALPMADSESLTISFADPMALLKDLRGMGETNAMHARLKHLSRSVLEAMKNEYRTRFMDEEGRIPATVEVVTLTGWKPHASQPKPLERGSGVLPFSAMLGE